MYMRFMLFSEADIILPFSRRGLRRRATLIILAAMYALYVSAVAYWVILVFGAIGYYHAAQAYWTQFRCQCITFSIWDTMTTPERCTNFEFGLSGTMHAMTTCVPTIILTVNVRFYSLPEMVWSSCTC